MLEVKKTPTISLNLLFAPRIRFAIRISWEMSLQSVYINLSLFDLAAIQRGVFTHGILDLDVVLGACKLTRFDLSNWLCCSLFTVPMISGVRIATVLR